MRDRKGKYIRNILQHPIKQEPPQKKTVGGKGSRTVETQILIPLLNPLSLYGAAECRSGMAYSHQQQSVLPQLLTHLTHSTLRRYCATHIYNTLRQKLTQALTRRMCANITVTSSRVTGILVVTVWRFHVKHFNDSTCTHQALQPHYCWCSVSPEQKNEKHTTNVEMQKQEDVFNVMMDEGRSEFGSVSVFDLSTSEQN